MYILLNVLKWRCLIRLHLIILTFVLSLDTIHVIDDNVEHSESRTEISIKNDISVDLILNSNNKDKNLIGKDLYNTERNYIFCSIDQLCWPISVRFRVEKAKSYWATPYIIS